MTTARVRTVEPHVPGYDPHGQLGLGAWKVADMDTGWRLFHIDRVTDLSTTNGKFPKADTGY